MVAIAAIQAPNLNTNTQNTASNHTSSALDLDGLVDPASQSDISTFHSTVQSIIQQSASAAAPSANSTYSANMVGNILSKVVDNVQAERTRVQELSANVGHLTTEDTLQLQESAESLSLTVQFLSKGVTLATKAIDTLIHIQ